MRISSLEEYGLRVALQLARSWSGLAPLSAAEVAKLEGLSIEYSSKILHLFKKSGVVSAQRGVRGGFRLSVDPSDLSVARVLEALQEKKLVNSTELFCQNHSAKLKSCVHTDKCNLQPIWMFLFEGFDLMLEDVFLSDLLLEKNILKEQIKKVAQQRLDRLLESIA